MQAISMDSCNADGMTSSMADDIFFVLQKCSRYLVINNVLVTCSLTWSLNCRRAFASANVDGACAMLNHAR